MKVGFISLGCSKNLVDTEMMIGIFQKKRFEITNNPKEAEIVVINTCGFIESAKEEAINTILEMAEYKKIGKCKFLIVTGCLIERYKEELEKEIPEVDLFIKFNEYNNFWKEVSNLVNSSEIKSKNYVDEKLDFNNRLITTGKNYAYVRVAEGCNNYCTFCAIPYIRGRFVSRKIENIIDEVNILTNKGFKEIIIIAQDTTKYGEDIYGKPMLAELLKNISDVKGVEWIRFLYAYPETLTDELIKEVKNNEKICKYFDIPIQHISNSILKSMNRKTSKESIINLIKKLRFEIPECVIRTTVMVGFPGETDKDFDELYDFIKFAEFDKLGCFKYSIEEGTVAAKMENQISEKVKTIRYNEIMKLQQKISNEKLQNKIGKKIKVLVEYDSDKSYDGKNDYHVGRSYMDCPEIDGMCFIKGKCELNKFVNCKIVGIIDDYDAEVEII